MGGNKYSQGVKKNLYAWHWNLAYSMIFKNVSGDKKREGQFRWWENKQDKRRRKAEQREEEEVRCRFSKGQGLQTDDQCPKALSDYLKINWANLIKKKKKNSGDVTQRKWDFWLLLKKIRKSGYTGSVYNLEENLLGWDYCSGNFNWGVGIITPQDPLPHTSAHPRKSLSPGFLHSLWCLSDTCRHLKTSVLPTGP